MNAPHGNAVLQQELIAKGVRYCIGAYVDIHGVPKAKVVPIAVDVHPELTHLGE